MALIWIIDAEQWPRAPLRAELIERRIRWAAVLQRPVSLGAIADRVRQTIEYA